MNPTHTPRQTTHKRSIRTVALASAALAALTMAACSSDTKLGDTTASTPSSSVESSGAESSTTSASTTTVSIETTAPPTTVAPSTTIVADVTTTTAAPVETTMVTVAPTTIAPAATCPAPVAPSATADGVSTVSGDWNGDGVMDTATAWFEPDLNDAAGYHWFLRADVTGGVSSSYAFPDLGDGAAEVVDRVDVDFSLGAPAGTNRDEILAIVGQNDLGQDLGVYGITDASPCVFAFDDGAGSQYLVHEGSSIAQSTSLICDGAAGSQFLVRLETTTIDLTNWNTRDIRIERTGDHSLADGVVLADTYSGPVEGLARYFESGCGGTVWIGETGDD